MKPLNPFRAPRFLQLVLALTLVGSAAAVQAQLRLPSLNLPLPNQIGQLGEEVLRDPGSRLNRIRELPDARGLRLAQVNKLLRHHRTLLEADPRGEPVVRREILAWSPSEAGLAAAAAAGLSVLRESRLDGLDEVLVVLKVPEALDTAVLLDALRKLDPDGTYDFNHVYTGSGAAGAAAPSEPERGAGASARSAATRIGLIDSGVDAGHDVFRTATIKRWGCGDALHPDLHGTAVAALMVGQSRLFRGVAPQARLYAADIYCNSGTGGSADRIASALAWMARENVAVINLSIVGPSNSTLERAVKAMQKRGHLLVAAVGNDGPAAPPLYPASYPGVVGVSAVDKRGRVLPEAGRGPQVMFAAPGNHMISAAPGDPAFRQVRGTSFAAPIVSALLAGELDQPDRSAAANAVAALARQAQRPDGAGVSNESGAGIVGQAYRTDPASLQ